MFGKSPEMHWEILKFQSRIISQKLQWLLVITDSNWDDTLELFASEEGFLEINQDVLLLQFTKRAGFPLTLIVDLFFI